MKYVHQSMNLVVRCFLLPPSFADNGCICFVPSPHHLSSSRPRSKPGSIGIPHISHFFYTGRILESQYFTPINYEKHPKITTICTKKCKICSFLRLIWKILHRTEFFYTGAACGACDKYEVCLLYWLCQ